MLVCKHWVSKRSRISSKYKHGWKSSWQLIKNIRFPAGKCPDIFFKKKKHPVVFPIVWKYPDVSLNTRSSFTLTNADVLSWTVNSHLPQLCHYTQVMSAWCDTYCRSFAKISVVCRKILSVWLSGEEGSSVCVSGAEVERVNSFRFFCHHTSPQTHLVSNKSTEKALLLK